MEPTPSGSPFSQTHRLLEQAGTLMIERNYGAALNVVEQIDLDFKSSPQTSASALAVRVKALQMLRRWQELVTLGESNLPTLASCSCPAELSSIHGSIGVGKIRLGDYGGAEQHLRAAIHLAVWEARDPSKALSYQKELGVMFKNLGSWQKARHEYLSVISRADEAGFVEEGGATRVNLAILTLKSGRVNDAVSLLDEAESLLTEAGYPQWFPNIRLARARHAWMVGRNTYALTLLEMAMGGAKKLSRTREEAIALEYMADCYLSLSDYTRALECSRAALKIAEETAPKGDLVPEICHRIAEALINLGDANQAVILCERGIRSARDVGDRYEECATQRVLAMGHRASGNPTKANRIALEGIELCRHTEIPFELARLLSWTGMTRMQSKTQDDQMAGRFHLWEARGIFERIGLQNEVRTLDRVLGFDEQGPTVETPTAAGVLSSFDGLNRGALRFGIITSDPEVSEAVAIIQSIAPSKIPVLITGASGVGKELLAHALHRMSDRRRMPFIPVNCGAISASLIESELFGHERGAFTGAVTSREGLFTTADKGTIFLDEVGELPPSSQATLLRVLETGELRRLGSDEVRSIDVRVVAATNANLDEMVERGQFRRDLFFRLEGVNVRVPPLREREDDIRALFRFFFAEAMAAAGKKLTVTSDVETLLCAYSWPGNVRELRNEVARAVAMADDRAVLGREAFLPKLRRKSATALREARERDDASADERGRILEALRAHGGNKADAARSLGGMKRTTLLYKIDRLKIRPEEYQVKER